jgi:hypothetical protein
VADALDTSSPAVDELLASAPEQINALFRPLDGGRH